MKHFGRLKRCVLEQQLIGHNNYSCFFKENLDTSD